MTIDQPALTHPAPPFDPELAAVLTALGDALPPSVTPEMIQPMRDAVSPGPTIDEILAEYHVDRIDRSIAGYDGAEILVSVLRKQGVTAPGPGFFHIHGGGMIIGDRFAGLPVVLDWVVQHDAVCVSVEYRLAPEHQDPAPVEDYYAGLVWTSEHAEEIGIDPERLVVVGASAGGGLAAGTALLARDRSGPALAGQILIYPMLDDRNETVSAHQIDGVGVWDRTANFTGWTALLGDRRGGEDVSVYAAPARAQDLSGLPPAYIDCGSAEVFRDEDVAYASTIWACGGVAALHVWPGGFHGFDLIAPHTTLSQAMVSTRTAWVDRLLER